MWTLVTDGYMKYFILQWGGYIMDNGRVGYVVYYSIFILLNLYYWEMCFIFDVFLSEFLLNRWRISKYYSAAVVFGAF